MTYQEIKDRLRDARKALDSGDVAGADSIIRAMVGRGLSRADLAANLSPSQLKKLRDHARKASQ